LKRSHISPASQKTQAKGAREVAPQKTKNEQLEDKKFQVPKNGRRKARQN